MNFSANAEATIFEHVDIILHGVITCCNIIGRSNVLAMGQLPPPHSISNLFEYDKLNGDLPPPRILIFPI
jgi:hypothetical protein